MSKYSFNIPSTKQSVITPVFEKRNICPRCNAKLTFKERYQKKHSESITCSHCGEHIQGDIVIIAGKKFPRELLRKR